MLRITVSQYGQEELLAFFESKRFLKEVERNALGSLHVAIGTTNQEENVAAGTLSSGWLA